MKDIIILYIKSLINDPLSGDGIKFENDRVKIISNLNRLKIFTNDIDTVKVILSEIKFVDGYEVTFNDPWYSFWVQSNITLEKI